MLHIDKITVSASVHALAVANNVSDAQMAAFIFRNFYEASHHMMVAGKIKRHAVAIANLTTEL